MSRLKQILNRLYGRENPATLSRQDLSDCIYNVFDQSLKRQTTREGLLFDTNYVIYLPDEIFQQQEDSFAHTAREVVNRCHATLRKIATRYPHYKPHSRCWKFRFINVTEDVDLGKNDQLLRENRIVIISSLFVEKRKPTGNKKKENCVMTVLTTQKKTEEVLSEYIALDGLTVLGKDSFEIKLDKFEKIEDLPVSDLESSDTDIIARAILKLKSGNFTDDSEFFYMTKESLYVVGEKYPLGEQTSIDEVATIEGEVPAQFFLHILAGKDGKFSICGDSEVLLNGSYHLSADKPRALQDNSSIALSNGTQIDFSIVR